MTALYIILLFVVALIVYFSIKAIKRKMKGIRMGWKVIHHTGMGCVYRINDYKTEEWTERFPDYGPLAVFKRRKHAEAFMMWHNLRYNTKLYRCEYVKSEDKSLWTPHDYQVDLGDLPAGTAFADKVKLLWKA